MANGLALVEDDYSVGKIASVKAKKVSKRVSKASAMKNRGGFGVRLLSTLRTKRLKREERKGSKKFKTSKTTSESTQGGFNLNDEADDSEEEIREERPIGRNRAKKKASSSSRYVAGGGLVELIVDK
ncbi:hypothetical protein Tco_0050852 [Tanacetum coccineum]